MLSHKILPCKRQNYAPNEADFCKGIRPSSFVNISTIPKLLANTVFVLLSVLREKINVTHSPSVPPD